VEESRGIVNFGDTPLSIGFTKKKKKKKRFLAQGTLIAKESYVELLILKFREDPRAAYVRALCNK
jgi:hypothetical protein